MRRRGRLSLCSILTALSSFVAVAGESPQTPTFSASVESVSVDVSVTREGRTLEGLRAEDFVLEDNGVRQKVEVLEASGTPVDAVLVLDVSSSVAGERFSALRTAAHAFVEALWATDSVTLICFSTDLRLVVPPGRPRPEVHAAIDRIEAGGATALVDATFAALLQTDGRRGRPVIVVFSDGVDHGSWLGAESVVAAAEACDAVVHYVEIEGAVSFLERLSDATGGSGWSARRWDALADAFVQALEEFRSRYRLRFEPTGVRREGYHPLAVALKDGKGKVRARTGYWVLGGRDAC